MDSNKEPMMDMSPLDERDKKIAELSRVNGILKANISVLYRTAVAEIERHKQRSRELQSELDDLLFKRMGINSTSQHQDSK